MFSCNVIACSSNTIPQQANVPAEIFDIYSSDEINKDTLPINSFVILFVDEVPYKVVIKDITDEFVLTLRKKQIRKKDITKIAVLRWGKFSSHSLPDDIESEPYVITDKSVLENLSLPKFSLIEVHLGDDAYLLLLKEANKDFIMGQHNVLLPVDEVDKLVVFSEGLNDENKNSDNSNIVLRAVNGFFYLIGCVIGAMMIRPC
ncbi:hypothetical protein [Thalassomonas sp. M1454]|uniref:hypothetical protein n=1 Tax=Thalassomonas sp. M1454 TaxID=2594477 RepID=UPI00117D424A|nr:hypothetical protein [Thalassomonas sp. M1454]TRX52483.1 hypothetical protein FNN08_16060 [Thalassomonas sp. M1454]